MAPTPDRRDPRARFLGDVLTFGWVLPASIGAGAGIGWLLDRLLKTSPVLTIVFAFVGLAAGLVQVYRESNVIAEDAGEGPPRPKS